MSDPTTPDVPPVPERQPDPTTPAPPPPAGVAPKRRSPTPWITIGIVLLVLSLFSWPRYLIQVIASVTRPELGISTAASLGGLTFGVALVVVGIVLLVNGVRISRANRG